MDEKSTQSIQAIDRALQVLELVSTTDAMSLKELYTELNVTKASMSRITTTLCRAGYLIQDEHSGEFTLSYKAFEIGVRAVKRINYINVIKSVLETLALQLDAIAQFSVEDHNELLTVECYSKDNANFSLYTVIGGRTTLYATSAGKAILSAYSNDKIEAMWGKLNVRKFMPNTITSLDAFMQEIATVRLKKYAVDMEETEPNVFCVGSPLLNYNRHPIGAISLSVSEMDKAREEELSKTLLEYTRRISTMLGYSIP